MAIVYAGCLMLGTWLLNLFFRKWFDIVLWPLLSDTWASWSQKRLQRTILSLEYELSNRISGSDIIIYGLKRAFLWGMYLVLFLGVWALPADFHLPNMLSLRSVNLPPSINATELMAWVRIALWAVSYLIALWYYQRLSTKYLHWKYASLYQGRLEKRIATLRGKVT
jgi:hypothetical protein